MQHPKKNKTSRNHKTTQFVCLFFVSYFQIKLLHSLYYAKACNKFVGPISASLHMQATQLFLKNVTVVASGWQHCV